MARGFPRLPTVYVTCLLAALATAGCASPGSETGSAAPDIDEADPSSAAPATAPSLSFDAELGVLDGAPIIPLPNLGDVVRYSKAGTAEGLEYAWLHDALAPLEDGTWTTINVIRARTLSGGQPADEHGDLFNMHGYQAGTLKAIAWYHLQHENATNPENMFAGVTTDAHESYMREGYAFMSPREEAGCGVRNPFQGQTEIQTVFTDPICFWRELRGPDWRVEWVVEEIDTKAGTFVAKASLHDPDRPPRPLTTHQYAAGNPYPIRIEEHDGTFWEQESLVRGDEPAASQPTRVGAPALEVADSAVWGPSEEGIDHPIPLSAAWQAAASSYEPLVSFLQDHPDAYIGSARSQIMSGKDDPLFMKWIIYAVDGPDGLGFVAQARELPLGVIGPFQFAADDDPNPFNDWYPLGKDRPARLPTVSSIWELASWAGAEWGPGAPNGWAFDLGCLAPDDCDRRGNRVTANWQIDAVPDPYPFLLGGQQRSMEQVSFDVDALFTPSNVSYQRLLQWYE